MSILTTARSLVSALLLSVAILAVSARVSPGLAEEPVLVFAAASLKNALDEIALQWHEQTGGSVRISFAGSSQLARQIQQGAPADLYVSANEAWMDRLEEEGLIVPESRLDLLNNRLVLIAYGQGAAALDLSEPGALSARLGDGRLAMALVDAVPAGIYGKAALESLNLWPQVEAQVAQADNVRAALALVARGEAPLGVVYATDAVADDNVTVVATFPEDSHPRIVYPAALTAETENPQAQVFLDHLSTPAARSLFERQGFAPLN